MNLVVFAPIASFCALVYALILAIRVKKSDEGTDRMKEISKAIKDGATAYLKRQYKTVAIFFALVFVVLCILSINKLINAFLPFAFLTGGVFSGLSGFLGMKIATTANARTAAASRKSLNSGLKVAFSSGAVMGFVVVGLGLFDLSAWFFLLKWIYRALPATEQAYTIATNMLTFGMGASCMALFARVGGGIFTKAADVGADLVGKVETGIPEDDPRNPAVIADNVGDNVGDVAGMGADLYESYVGSIVSAGALAVGAKLGFAGVTLPLIMAGIGVICSIIGSFFVKTGDNMEQKTLLAALRKGTYISSALFALSSFVLVRFVFPENMGIYFAVLSGLLAGILIGFFTEFFTSDTYKPTQKLSETAKTGSATIIIGGFSLGLSSTAIPVIIVGASVIISFLLAGGGVAGTDVSMGLYGIGVSAVGMLSTLGITLATDAYGPVADNAGGIAQMAGLEEVVRERTDALDSLGNTTAATGKGFAIGSAALTALALIVAYIDQAKTLMGSGAVIDLSIVNPPVLIGMFVGAMIPFLFASLTMDAVGRAAQLIVVEVRRQFKEIAGIMTGEGKADYASCVDICTKAALKEMILPAVIAIISPLAIGIFLGVSGVSGMLAGATASGFILAIMMANSGGAWDNAKKYIESGKFGGKGSDAHKAAVVGDTVGDPFKDTSGPAINILIKFLSIVSIVFLAVIVNYSIL